jgi:hypothetical protein
LFALFFLAAPLIGFADQDFRPQDERASAFVAGEADLSETFGPIEGALLFGSGSAAIVAVFSLCFLSGAIQRRNRAQLEKMELASEPSVPASKSAPANGDKRA